MTTWQSCDCYLLPVNGSSKSSMLIGLTSLSYFNCVAMYSFIALLLFPTVLIQVGGRADEGGCAALVTLGAARLGRRDKHTPPQSKQSVNLSGLPKKICKAKIFWEEGEKRIMRISTACCARASNCGFCLISAKYVTTGGTSPWCRQDDNRTKRAGCLGKLPEKRGLRRRKCAGGQGAPLKRLQSKSTYSNHLS